MTVQFGYVVSRTQTFNIIAVFASRKKPSPSQARMCSSPCLQVLMAGAFPLAALLSAVTNLIESRSDITKVREQTSKIKHQTREQKKNKQQ
jgi:hypothetical protein